jgi:hypothetical protein
MNMHSLGTTANQILDEFRRIDRENVGRRITEAFDIGNCLRFRWQGNGKLGVAIGAIGIRDATEAEYSDLEEAIELGQVQIYTLPLYVSGQSSVMDLLHQATGFPLDQNSDAARRQKARWDRAINTTAIQG